MIVRRNGAMEGSTQLRRCAPEVKMEKNVSGPDRVRASGSVGLSVCLLLHTLERSNLLAVVGCPVGHCRSGAAARR